MFPIDLDYTDFADTNVAAFLSSFKSFSTCFSALTDAELWTIVLDVIKAISPSMCWGDSFTRSTRTQDVPLVDLSRKTKRVKLLYPENVNITEIRIYLSDDSSVTEYTVSAPMALYRSFSNEVVIPYNVAITDGITPTTLDLVNLCKQVDVRITYTAGYGTIDRAWYGPLSRMCQAVVLAGNNCATPTISACFNDEAIPLGATLTSKAYGDSKWTWQPPESAYGDVLGDIQSYHTLTPLLKIHNCNNVVSSVNTIPW